MAASWIDREPGLRVGILHLRRLVRRSMARGWLVLLLATLVTSAAVVRRGFSHESYPARIALRATEGEFEPNRASEGGAESPRVASRLRDYVTTVVFTDTALLDVMQRHNINASKVKSNPRLALKSFREDIDVQVFRNDFIYERQPGDPPRSVRLEIGILAPDPREALLIAQDLGDLVITHEARRRAETLAAGQALLGEVVQGLELEIGSRERQLAEMMVTAHAERPSAGGSSGEIQNLMQSLTGLRRQYTEARRDQQDLAIRSSLDERELGLRFERVDWRMVEMPTSHEEELLWTGILVFLLTFPLIAIAVGAFDSRVYDPRDVRRLGMQALGLIRAWPRQAVALQDDKAWRRSSRTARA